jgi:hypothetical protein
MTRDEMIALGRSEAVRNGLRPETLLGLLDQESRFNPNAVSPVGAVGVAQFMPATARRFGIDARDPAQAIPAAAKYLGQLQKQFGSERSALQAYNWGEGNLKSWLKTGRGVKGQVMPNETKNYAAGVMSRSRGFMDQGAAPAFAAMPSVLMAPESGVQPRIAVAGNEEEAGLMRGLSRYPAHVQQGMAGVLAQLLPVRDALAGRDVFGQGIDDPFAPAMPDDYDELINEIIDMV